jgi:hypothetical protein
MVGVGRLKTHGVMEWWSNGILAIKSGPPQADYLPPCTIHIKTDLIPPNPIPQHSITPTCPAEVTPRRDEGGYSVAFISGTVNLL